MASRHPISSILLDDHPGVNRLVEDCSRTEYDQLVGMNPSTIVPGVKSMLHLKHAWDVPQLDSDAMLWGRAGHCLLFEPRQFEGRFRPWDGRRQGNAWKDFLADCHEAGAEPIPQKAFDEVQAACLACVNHPRVQPLISAGRAEVTLLATEATGAGTIQCRGRVDWISASQHVLVDLKTTKDLAQRAFSHDFYKYHYDIKLGLYQRWLERITDERWPVVVIGLEKAPPYDCVVMPVPDAVLWQGAAKGFSVIGRLPYCIRFDKWPGTDGGGDYVLDTPAWEMDDDGLEGAEEVNDDTVGE